MRLNPEKCAFGVQKGKFLGFLLTNRGIEANPDKCQAIINMQSPRTIKEVQCLTGRLAVLSRFLPRQLPDHTISSTQKKANKFMWTEECEKTFAELKQILGLPHILKKPEQGSPKAQALADLISEFTNKEETPKTWELYVDGASNESGYGAGILLKDSIRVRAEQSIKFLFETTNNQAEYEALLARLRLAREVEVTSLKVYYDSLLVVQQVNGHFQKEDWLSLFIHYLKTGEILENKNTRSFRYKANHYTMMGTDLYKRSISRPLLKCRSRTEAENTIEEVHEGICGHHTGSRSLATKIHQARYYWPTIREDCRNKVQKCDACQKCAPLIHNLAELLHTSDVS
ncbi:uncharacterized protein [Arachis hypogaea]|uniref:uncharacterized protein n=1 Tax=Arachis hypogaea TaxID=3818 RepID=UPI003B21FA75